MVVRASCPGLHGLEARATALRGWGREPEGGGRGMRPLALSLKLNLSKGNITMSDTVMPPLMEQVRAAG
jgi:hypothetical protein